MTTQPFSLLKIDTEGPTRYSQLVTFSHAKLLASARFIQHDFQALRKVHKTGVIYVTEEAQKMGYYYDHPEWANFGQGAPETGPIPNAPSRQHCITLDNPHQEYAPVNGLKELRLAIANYYNHFFRKGKKTLYSHENICVVPGGRAGLTRIMSILGETEIGYFMPDYTAYSEALGLFNRFAPVPLLHDQSKGYQVSPDELERMVKGTALGSLLISNPTNPTGQVVRGASLQGYVETARTCDCLMLMDEFYSHYLYEGEGDNIDADTDTPPMMSSAAYVEDVNSDPILIINGLTKNWRLPGWRIAWVVGPKSIVDLLSSAGSYLDGGANNPLQLHALPYMDVDFIKQDTRALQAHFKMKRDFMMNGLEKLGIYVKRTPLATFYIWADLSALPCPLNDGVHFFEACLTEKVIVTPGIFFDLSPRGLRKKIDSSQCLSYIRISYGPPMEQLERGLAAFERLIKKRSLN